jgi:hypothetical protein
MDGGTSAMSTVTCHTEGCGNNDIPIEMELATRDGDGIVRQTVRVVCGVCSKPITDIQR